MTEGILYNGKKFPEYIFTKDVKSYLFIEFDFVFDKGFWAIFKFFLKENKIQTFIVENLRPEIEFIASVEVANLPKSFIEATNTSNIGGYLPSKESLYLITSETVIYSSDNKQLFCILIDREYDLAILGFSDLIYADVVEGLDIKDVSDYLTLCFGGKGLPSRLKESLHQNWGLPPSQF